MSDQDRIKQPRDHLQPLEERPEETDLDEQQYPDVGAPAGSSAVSKDTEAEPDKPRRHGVDKLPPTGR